MVSLGSCSTCAVTFLSSSSALIGDLIGVLTCLQFGLNITPELLKLQVSLGAYKNPLQGFRNVFRFLLCIFGRTESLDSWPRYPLQYIPMHWQALSGITIVSLGFHLLRSLVFLEWQFWWYKFSICRGV